MTAGEFGRWLAFFEEEPAGGTSLAMWAAVMAALNNGPRLKKSKAAWRSEDFVPNMPWSAPAKAAAAPKKAGIADARAHVRALRGRGSS